MNPDELLNRISKSLKQDIGPAVGNDYAKTQAFMASAVLDKLSRQLALAPRHAASDRVDLAALAATLTALCDEMSAPPALRSAVQNLTDRTDNRVLNALIRILYENASVLGEEAFRLYISPVRKALRARIDRQIEFAA